MELDYQEGIELRKAGDPESARDALRYALQGCGDNLWVHVALGQLALQDFQEHLPGGRLVFQSPEQVCKLQPDIVVIRIE